jgi:hypothetical protein
VELWVPWPRWRPRQAWCFLVFLIYLWSICKL